MRAFYGRILTLPPIGRANLPVCHRNLANQSSGKHGGAAAPPYRGQYRDMPSINHHAGFSLIEVMVAILILAIALTGLTAGITTALSCSKESELQTTAALFASGQIELLRAQTDWKDGTEQGDCGATLPLYRWRQTVSPTDVNGLHEVDVVVENSRTGQEIYELKTMLFQIPDESPNKSNPSTAKGNQS